MVFIFLRASFLCNGIFSSAEGFGASNSKVLLQQLSRQYGLVGDLHTYTCQVCLRLPFARMSLFGDAQMSSSCWHCFGILAHGTLGVASYLLRSARTLTGLLRALKLRLCGLGETCGRVPM